MRNLVFVLLAAIAVTLAVVSMVSTPLTTSSQANSSSGEKPKPP
jgi:hypothetical protein